MWQILYRPLKQNLWFANWSLISFFLKKRFTYKDMVYTYIKLPGKQKKSWKYILLLINTLGFRLDTIWKIGCLLESECSNCHSKSKLVKRYSWATQTLEHNDLAPTWWPGAHSTPPKKNCPQWSTYRKLAVSKWWWQG